MKEVIEVKETVADIVDEDIKKLEDTMAQEGLPNARRVVYARMPGLYQLFPENKGTGRMPHQWRNNTGP